MTDFPMMMRIMVTVSSMSRDVRPQLWRRYAEMPLDAAIDAPASSRESEPPLTESEAIQIFAELR
ncbi:MAG: hypothetical protein ACR2M5_10355 [Nakamurella sp.]